MHGGVSDGSQSQLGAIIHISSQLLSGNSASVSSLQGEAAPRTLAVAAPTTTIA